MTRARLVLLVATVLLLAGCSHSTTGTTAPPDPSQTPVQTPVSSPVTPPPAAPTVGACRTLSYADISHYSNAAAPVDCTKTHTAYTFAVQDLPASVDVQGASIGNRSIQSAASTGCKAAFQSFIGGTDVARALTRLTVTYFLPDQPGFDAGAHWVRCDVVALNTPTTLGPLPAHVGHLLDDTTAAAKYNLCSQGTPGGDTTILVMCARTHDYRAETAIRLGADAASYPGDTAVGADGQQQCAAYLKGKLGTDAGYTYGWTFPTEHDWASGQRFGYCWLQSAN
jgi:hypothetical protein